MNGSAALVQGTDTFTLTPDANGMTGSVFSNKVIDLTRDFSINFDVKLGNKDAARTALRS